MISVLKKEVATLSNKARFIKMVIEDELIIKRKKRAVLVNELYDLKFDTQTMLNEKKQKTKEEMNKEHELQNSEQKGENEGNNSDEEQEKQNKDKIKPKVPIKEYDYLLNMNLWSLTHEKIEELLKQKELKEKELSVLEQTEVETLWDNDLDNLEEELTRYENMEEEDRLLAQKLNKGKSKGAIPKRRRGGRKKKNSEGKSEDNDNEDDNKSENTNSNNTSLISDSTNIITKKNKTKNKTKKPKKEKGQTSLNNFVKSPNKEKKKKNKENKNENEIKNSESLSKSSDNEKDELSEKDDSESNPFNIPLKERLKKKIIDIGESPVPLDNLNYGNTMKRDFSDDDSFSDLNLSAFDEKEKVED